MTRTSTELAALSTGFVMYLLFTRGIARAISRLGRSYPRIWT